MLACRDLRADPGVRNCGSHIGQALLADEVLRRRLRRELDQRRAKTSTTTNPGQGPGTVDRYPGPVRDVQTYLQRTHQGGTHRNERVGGGPDLSAGSGHAAGPGQGHREAHCRRRRCRRRPASFQTDLANIEVEPDVAAARRHGLTPGDIRRQASTWIASEEVSDIYSGGRAYDVHVTSIPSARDSVTDVENLPIDTPGGGRVRLKDVADVRLASTPNAIERDNQSRTDRRRRECRRTGSGQRWWTRSRIRLDARPFPLGYHYEVLGESNELEGRPGEAVGYSGLAALLTILLLLQAALGSFRLALLTFLAASRWPSWAAWWRCFLSGGSAVLGFARRIPDGVRHRRT